MICRPEDNFIGLRDIVVRLDFIVDNVGDEVIEWTFIDAVINLEPKTENSQVVLNEFMPLEIHCGGYLISTGNSCGQIAVGRFVMDKVHFRKVVVSIESVF